MKCALDQTPSPDDKVYLYIYEFTCPIEVGKNPDDFYFYATDCPYHPDWQDIILYAKQNSFDVIKYWNCCEFDHFQPYSYIFLDPIDLVQKDCIILTGEDVKEILNEFHEI